VLPEADVARVRELCTGRVPGHARNQVRVELEQSRQAVTIVECRPVRELLELHARACDAGMADPVKLAEWMARFRFVDQDFFEPDPVRYRAALGGEGLAAYRSAVEQHADQDEFAVRYARERLAIIDRDPERVVELLGGDLSAAPQFIAVAEAMRELDRLEDALAWAVRGIRETSGWQTDRLYDLACKLHASAGRPAEALALRRAQHERAPTATSYGQLARTAEPLGAWAVERGAALRALRERNPVALVDALLTEGQTDAAWDAAHELEGGELGERQWLRLAEARERSHPADAIPVYLRIDAHTLGALGITADELTDPDTRAIAIRRDHPDLDRALRHGEDVIEVAGEPMNVRLHLAMHETVAAQLDRGRSAGGVSHRSAAARLGL